MSTEQLLPEHHCPLLDISDDYIYFNGENWVLDMNPDSHYMPDRSEYVIIIFCFKCGKKLEAL